MPGTLAVLLATAGRPKLVADLVQHLGQQSRPPDHIFVVGADASDLSELPSRGDITAMVGRRGLSKQRNDALPLAADYQTIVFFDDDFEPSRFWLERAEKLFTENPELVCLTGHVIADGIRGPGIPQETAREMVKTADTTPPIEAGFDFSHGPYGCNMTFRTAAITGLTFDERLPLYSWLEDLDFGERVRERGRYAKTALLWGVHMGTKNGKVPGRRLGYSQIANALYLVRKGTLKPRQALNIVARNLYANSTRALRPEPWIDRRGRLSGNLIALLDALRARLAPERAAEL